MLFHVSNLWKNHQFNAQLFSVSQKKFYKQDTVFLWSRSSTLDQKVEGSNPAIANFSFEVDDLDEWRKKKKTETKTGAPANDHWRASALEIDKYISVQMM